MVIWSRYTGTVLYFRIFSTPNSPWTDNLCHSRSPPDACWLAWKKPCYPAVPVSYATLRETRPYRGDTRSRNLYQKLAPNRTQLWCKFLVPVRSACVTSVKPMLYGSTFGRHLSSSWLNWRIIYCSWPFAKWTASGFDPRTLLNFIVWFCPFYGAFWRRTIGPTSVRQLELKWPRMVYCMDLGTT